jgi:hypothetical protein
MTWLSKERAAQLENETNAVGGSVGADLGKRAQEALISDCGFGGPKEHKWPVHGAPLPDVIGREKLHVGRDKGYIDCEWGKLLEENRKLHRPRYHEGMVPPVIRESEPNKGYIDCGWGRLLDYNKRHEHTKLGMELLGRKPFES